MVNRSLQWFCRPGPLGFFEVSISDIMAASLAISGDGGASGSAGTTNSNLGYDPPLVGV